MDKGEVLVMSNQIKNWEEEAKKKAKELAAIKQKIKAKKKIEEAAKTMAIGAGVQSAIKAGDMQWSEVKNILHKHVKNKKHRALLNLSKTEEGNESSKQSIEPSSSSSDMNFFSGSNSNQS